MRPGNVLCTGLGAKPPEEAFPRQEARVPGDRSTVIVCFAHGRPGEWEAFCADFDISVQGRDFHEVQCALEAAIRDYVEAACQESAEDRDRLLSRRAPLWRRLWWSMMVVASAWRHRNKGDRDSAASFPVAFA